jgi:hypothetical protein
MTGLAVSDLAIQAGMNWWEGNDIWDGNCYDWTQVGIGGALGAFTGGIGGTGFRTAAGLSTKFSNVSRRIRRVEDLVGSGEDLHHWLLPRRWETAFDGRAGRIVNGRWNLNPIPELMHDRLHSSAYNWLTRTVGGSPTWAWQAGSAGGASVGVGVAGDWYNGN